MQGDKNRYNTSQNSNNSSNRSNTMLVKKLIDAFNNQRKPKDEKQSYAQVYQEKRHDWHDKVGLIIQGMLAVFTFGLFYQTVAQLEEVKKSTNAAIEMANQTIKANKIAQDNYNLAFRSFQSNNESSNKAMDLAKQSLNNQETSLNESKKQYLLQNQPHLEISSVGMFQFKEGLPIAISFKMTYSNNLPAKIIDTYQGFTLIADSFYNPFKDKAPLVHESGGGSYANKEGTLLFYDTKVILNEEIRDQLAKGKMFYYYGIVNYINPVNNIKMRYRYNVRFILAPLGYILMINENLPVKAPVT